MADPEFPLKHKGYGANLLFAHIFPQQLHEKERNWTERKLHPWFSHWMSVYLFFFKMKMKDAY